MTIGLFEIFSIFSSLLCYLQYRTKSLCFLFSQLKASLIFEITCSVLGQKFSIFKNLLHSVSLRSIKTVPSYDWIDCPCFRCKTRKTIFLKLIHFLKDRHFYICNNDNLDWRNSRNVLHLSILIWLSKYLKDFLLKMLHLI
jgi:hypothetical protein